MNSTHNPSHYVTDEVIELVFQLFPMLHANIDELGLTDRPLQGTVMVEIGDYVVIKEYTDGIFKDVVSGKRDITHAADAATSGDARDHSVVINGEQYIFKGFVRANGLGIGYSGAEEDWDECYGWMLHAFVMALVAMFKKVTNGATSIKKAGDPLAATDVGGHAILLKLPTGVQALFPNEVCEPKGVTKQALGAYMGAHG